MPLKSRPNIHPQAPCGWTPLMLVNTVQHPSCQLPHSTQSTISIKLPQTTLCDLSIESLAPPPHVSPGYLRSSTCNMLLLEGRCRERGDENFYTWKVIPSNQNTACATKIPCMRCWVSPETVGSVTMSPLAGCSACGRLPQEPATSNYQDIHVFGEMALDVKADSPRL